MTGAIRARAPLAAWPICAASILGALLGTLAFYASGWGGFNWSSGVDAICAVAFPLVGAVVASKRPENSVGWIFCLVGLFQGAAFFSGGYAEYAFSFGGRPLEGGVLAAWATTWLWVPGVALGVVMLPLVFPHGSFLSPRWRYAGLLCALVVVLGAATIAVAPWSLVRPGVPAKNPFEVRGTMTIIRVSEVPLVLLIAACGILAALALVLRLARSRGEERQQVEWFVYAAIAYLSTVLLPFPLANHLQVVTAPMVPVAAGVAILRYRLYEIDRVINKTLVYGTLSAALALVYLGSVVSLQEVFRLVTGDASQAAVVASTLAVAALFNPLRRRVQGFIDRRFYRRRYDAQKTLDGFAARLRERTDLEDLGQDLVLVVRRTMQPESVRLWLGSSEPRREPEGKLLKGTEKGVP